MTDPASSAPSESDVRCDDSEGRAFREGVYRPLEDTGLEVASSTPDFPDPGAGPPFRRVDEVPRVPRIRNLIGPSMIALGMGLGAGEFLLWPNLIAVNGYSIWWLFLAGVLTQWVVILEIERWTIATGESVFAGMGRLTRRGGWPWFFVVVTLISFFWPGWASQSGEFLGAIVQVATGTSLPWQPIALLLMVVIWCALAFSRIVYNALERFEMGLVFGFFPLLVIVLLVAKILPADVIALLKGAVSVGSAPEALLTGNQFPTLLLAVAYAGSGGTLLLAQSLWLRDKGFGMACYQGRIAGFRGENEPVSDTGYVFSAGQPTALARFRCWMRVAGGELFLTFVTLIILSVVITTLVVGSTIGTSRPDLAGRLNEMVRLQGNVLAEVGGVWLQLAFLVGGALVLFSTQLGIVDTVTRIAGTVFYERYGRRTTFWTLKRTFLFFLTLFVGASMAIIVLSWAGGETLDRLQPDFLVLIAGPFTIASMYVFTLVIGVMNVGRLPKALATPGWGRAGMIWAGVLWGWFTAEQLSRTLLGLVGADQAAVETIAPHPLRIVLYSLWIGSLVWAAWKMFRR